MTKRLDPKEKALRKMCRGVFWRFDQKKVERSFTPIQRRIFREMGRLFRELDQPSTR